MCDTRFEGWKVGYHTDSDEELDTICVDKPVSDSPSAATTSSNASVIVLVPNAWTVNKPFKLVMKKKREHKKEGARSPRERETPAQPEIQQATTPASTTAHIVPERGPPPRNSCMIIANMEEQDSWTSQEKLDSDTQKLRSASGSIFTEKQSRNVVIDQSENSLPPGSTHK